jgi:ribosomal protein L40E
MTFCSHCGTQLSDENYFCPKCGTKTQKGVQDNIKYPTDQLRDAFTQAGREMEKAFTIAATELHKAFQNVREDFKNNPEQTTTQQATVSKVNCINCGAINEPDAVFCRNCGTKLAT